MWVRPPPPAPKRRKLKRKLSFFIKFVSGSNGRKSEGNRVCVRPPRRDSGTASEAQLSAERPPPPAPKKIIRSSNYFFCFLIFSFFFFHSYFILQFKLFFVFLFFISSFFTLILVCGILSPAGLQTPVGARPRASRSRLWLKMTI